MDKQEQDIKLKLLNSLLDHLDGIGADSISSKLKQKMSVEVAAPDKESLAEGLEHAKDLTDSPELDSLGSDPDHDSDDDSDEQRMMELLGKDDDDDSKGSLGDFFHR